MTVPQHNQFIAACREQFDFLESQFGFRMLPTPREFNAFSVRWRKGEFGVDVYGEGYGETASCDLRIGESDVLFLVLLVPVAERRALNTRKHPPEQLEQVRILAELLQAHASDFLTGDRTRFDAALTEWRRVTAPRPQTPEDLIQKARLVAATEAGHAFKRGEYAAVVRLLEAHEGHLSQHQQLMLNEARVRYRDAAS